jgi:hypothetical protein
MNNKCMMISNISKMANLSQKIEQDLKNYLKYEMERSKESLNTKNLKGILSEIPYSLKLAVIIFLKKIAHQIFDGFVSKIHIFASCDKHFLAEIIPLLQPMFLQVGQFVYHVDDVPEKSRY